MDSSTTTRRAVYFARVLIALALATLLGAWITQVTGTPLFGMTQQHLFNDTIALALLGIAIFIDAFWHGRNV